ncbi:FAD-dependent oxidoreductase [Streptomyces sp. MW-W600-10]|uniref:FAD-dependent oxidoreductase n=1 Tax=Streptomyces sp. MW-W600-10 TaxID=2829819 RepID=UPI001C44F058|nr:BBE domain-containing protein [Streptomyces sp. MW-W600-10]MBV7243610.1 FAD-binding protein [Streptomyces sp. MW-W600-10]
MKRDDSNSAAEKGPAILAPNSTLVTPDDIRYENLCHAYNYRFVAKPDYFRLVHSPRQAEEAVREAVAAGKRITVRSRGHCGEDFVAAPDVEVILDLSPMSRVDFDPERNAFVIEAGAPVGTMIHTLFHHWGVTVPVGFCMGVGAGGHISGGGYGPLSRQLGLSVDHLYAVEVVVVDRDRKVSTVVATREENDPNRDLWWAHTGGGGGNFGVITRYWMRSPEASGTDPAGLLPRPPGALHIAEVSWPWDRLTEAGFVRLIGNFMDWQMANSAVGSPNTDLYALLDCQHRSTGNISLHAHVPVESPDAPARMRAFLDALDAGVGVAPTVRRTSLPWLAASQYLAVPDTGPTAIGLRCKVKSADLRAPHSADQLAALYRHLTDDDYQGTYAAVEYIAYGGKVNTVPSAATAIPRGALLKTFYMVTWQDPAEDDKHLRWIRELYRDVHSSTGGVPVPNGINTGAYINYADIDLADPEWNTSGVPWHALHYGENYPRLQEVKAKWDALNIFRHALSITATSTEAEGK